MEKFKRKQKEIEYANKKLSSFAKQNTKYLEPEQEGYIIPDEGEETNKLEQEKIKQFIPNYNVENIFDLTLPSGPFSIDYSSNGRRLLLKGKNTASIINWRDKDVISEINLEESETIRDGKFINNDNMIALSQEDSVCIYDNQGLEVHNLTNYYKPRFLENLPFHYLLVCSTKNK